jgi:hypothetical protein
LSLLAEVVVVMVVMQAVVVALVDYSLPQDMPLLLVLQLL